MDDVLMLKVPSAKTLLVVFFSSHFKEIQYFFSSERGAPNLSFLLGRPSVKDYLSDFFGEMLFKNCLIFLDMACYSSQIGRNNQILFFFMFYLDEMFSVTFVLFVYTSLHANLGAFHTKPGKTE